MICLDSIEDRQRSAMRSVKFRTISAGITLREGACVAAIMCIFAALPFSEDAASLS